MERRVVCALSAICGSDFNTLSKCACVNVDRLSLRSVGLSLTDRIPVEACQFRAQELCESGGGRPGLLVPNTSVDFCGRKAKLIEACLLPQFYGVWFG